MTRTTTRFLKFNRFQASGESAITVIKLMMACNDLSLANQSLSEWKKEQPISKRSRQVGAGMYFVRAQLAHLHEGFKIIEEIQKDSVLMALVARCDGQTQQSFKELEKFLPKAQYRPEFEQLIGRVRHNLTFHYDESGKLIEQAISDRTSDANATISSITRGDSSSLWHFKIADDVVDSIVVHQIWGIPRTLDTQVEADRIADRVHQILLWFIDFSGDFIWKYCEG